MIWSNNLEIGNVELKAKKDVNMSVLLSQKMKYAQRMETKTLKTKIKGDFEQKN
jgi:hypothetical protein